MASTIPVTDVSSTANGSAESTGESSHPYTLDTLKQHGTRDDLWLLLHDKVYNVTKFLDEHPGGDEVLLEEAGELPMLSIGPSSWASRVREAEARMPGGQGHWVAWRSEAGIEYGSGSSVRPTNTKHSTHGGPRTGTGRQSRSERSRGRSASRGDFPMLPSLRGRSWKHVWDLGSIALQGHG